MGLRLSGGRRLQSPPGDRARPTSSRVRLAAMNLLAPALPSCRWLDLCCGSGLMACEALQRGAALVVAVEQDRRIAATARANLETVQHGLARATQVTVHTCEVRRWLQRSATSLAAQSAHDPGFDLIYLDPPYGAGLYLEVTHAVTRGHWLRSGGTLIWECDSSTIPEIPSGWSCHKQRRYGRTTLLLLEQVDGQGSAKRECGASAAENGAAAVLIPGGHEQTHQGHWNQTEHDAAEQGFDHGEAVGSGAPQFFHAPGRDRDLLHAS